MGLDICHFYTVFRGGACFRAIPKLEYLHPSKGQEGIIGPALEKDLNEKILKILTV